MRKFIIMRALRPWHRQPRAAGALFLQVLRAMDGVPGCLNWWATGLGLGRLQGPLQPNHVVIL